MIEKDFEYIANYLWQQSINNINSILSNEEKRQFNITDYYYLTTIYNMDNPNLGEIAEKLKLTKPAISALVKRLAKHNLIEKIKSEEDGRIYYLKVTEKGVKIIEGDNALYKEFADLISEMASKEQLEELNYFLDKIVRVLKSKE
ncbi:MULTISPECIES: MarR family transcriptional regulator [unclassified Clostridium]|uniref:MarR family transcriptional regulator n=1 Tax=unclassified Clostridium TaxID=2614128 RepID=UPI000297DA5C|nr:MULTISPECIES: MarR family transcriptional regulator [unclassified Clostridium]EKQ52264.1 MAG: transcriptional regulator [Clostridium sp. Maddingley MBC34-26]